MSHYKKNLILFDDTQPLKVSNKFIINGTVELKANFIKNAQLAGVLVHLIDMDDYTGKWCHRGPFPIASVVYRVFSKLISSKQTTTSSTTTTATTSTGICSGVQSRDLLADDKDCQYFYVCRPSNINPIARLQCPNNMYFSSKQKACTRDPSVS
jgi:hypothetical protein